MKEVKYHHMESIGMFRENAFDPLTKEKQSKPSTMSCKVDDRHDTGLIICKDEGNAMPAWKIAIAAVILIVVTIFSFSIEVEVMHLEEVPVLSFIVSRPQIIVLMIAVIVIVIAIARKYR